MTLATLWGLIGGAILAGCVAFAVLVMTLLGVALGLVERLLGVR